MWLHIGALDKMRILASSKSFLIEVVIFVLIQLKIEIYRLSKAKWFENELKQLLQEQFQLENQRLFSEENVVIRISLHPRNNEELQQLRNDIRTT